MKSIQSCRSEDSRTVETRVALVGPFQEEWTDRFRPVLRICRHLQALRFQLKRLFIHARSLAAALKS